MPVNGHVRYPKRRAGTDVSELRWLRAMLGCVDCYCQDDPESGGAVAPPIANGLRRFAADERGSYTLWSLVWFMLYVALGGVTVDVTDAYRNQTLLQSTADAAVLAAVMLVGAPGEDPLRRLWRRQQCAPDLGNGHHVGGQRKWPSRNHG